jgi:nucleotide-binding universal stress UspA family protein
MFTHLLVPLDGSPTARLALTRAADPARLSGARPTLLHVFGVNRWLLGSDAEPVARMASVPGLLVRDPQASATA